MTILKPRLGLLSLALLLALVVIGVAFVAAARFGWLTPKEAVLRESYTLPDSQFVQIDGQNVHFVDQGEGPAVVLMHGTFGSLHNWEHWAAVLTERYRVIRFDRPRMGLSGPAPASRSGPEQELKIISALTEKLKVERFFLVATSSAGASGGAYAAQNPLKVQGLILSNIAIGDYIGRSKRPWTLRLMLKIDPWLGGWRSVAFWRQVLLINFFNDDKVTDSLAREWSELNNRARRMPGRVAYPISIQFNALENLQQMKVPTLLLWSDHDHERPLEMVGQLGFERLSSPDKQLDVVAECGHIMPLDCGIESALKALAFFDRLVLAEPLSPPENER